MVNVAGDNLSEARLAEPLCGVEHHLAQRLQDCFALIIFEAVISEVLSSFPQKLSDRGSTDIVGCPREHLQGSLKRRGAFKGRLSCENVNVIVLKRLQIWWRWQVILSVQARDRITGLQIAIGDDGAFL